MNMVIRLFLIIITFSLAACGGGGGGGSSSSTPVTPSAKTTAVLKIGTTGTPSAAVVGVGVTLTLPAGVTIDTNSDGSVPVTAANVSDIAQGWGFSSVYTAATNATIWLVASKTTANPYQAGYLFTVTCKLPAGNTLTDSDFSAALVTSFDPSDAAGSKVNGLLPTVVPTLR